MLVVPLSLALLLVNSDIFILMIINTLVPPGTHSVRMPLSLNRLSFPVRTPDHRLQPSSTDQATTETHRLYPNR